MFEKDFEAFMKSMGISFENMSHDSCDCEHDDRMPRKGVYGLHISVGPDGIPHVEEFGDYKTMDWKNKFTKPQKMATRKKTMLSENIEIIENATETGGKIIAEMPGLEKEDIKITTRGIKLFISASRKADQNGGTERVYNEKVLLPVDIDTKSIKASYKNGILEVTFDYSKEIESNKINIT